MQQIERMTDIETVEDIDGYMIELSTIEDIEKQIADEDLADSMGYELL